LKFLSKKKPANQTAQAEPQMPKQQHLNAISRNLRLANARIGHLEELASTLRRDLNRIERKSYRDLELIEKSPLVKSTSPSGGEGGQGDHNPFQALEDALKL